MALETERKIEIECGKLFKIKTPEGDISPVGMSELENFLISNGYGYLPEHFEPLWTTKQGTLPKRIQSHLYKNKSIKLLPADLSEIGNIAKRHSSDGKEFILDFTQRIDWQDGAFGDGGSCFWGDKSGAKTMLENNSAYAIRGWKLRNGFSSPLIYNNVKGYCRAWVAPLGDNTFAVFNGYGETTLTMARLLSLKYSCGYKRISLTNNGCDDGAIWINGGMAYVIGAWQKIHHIEKADLGWEEVYDDNDSTYCHACDDRVAEPYTAYDRYGDEYQYCSECVAMCRKCGDWFEAGLVKYFEPHGEHLCRACLEGAREAEEREESEVTV